tara:strand:+ start:151 stop:306 length:156 start_codon:yes stop_codon:yes gene_type:complete
MDIFTLFAVRDAHKTKSTGDFITWLEENISKTSDEMHQEHLKNEDKKNGTR